MTDSEILSVEEAIPSSIGDSNRDPLLEVDTDAERSLCTEVAFKERDNLERGLPTPAAVVEELPCPTSCESLDCRWWNTLLPVARDKLVNPGASFRARLFVAFSLVGSSPSALDVSLGFNLEKMAFILLSMASDIGTRWLDAENGMFALA